MRIGVVGCGSHSGATHGPCLRQYAALHPDITLAACCDRDLSAAELYRKQFGFERTYQDIHEMLREEALDAVWIIVQERQTAFLAQIVLEKGIPVFMEKPPGIDARETLTLMEIAEKHGVPHRVAFNRRYAPLACQLAERLAPEKLGRRIFSVSYDMIRVNRRDPDFSSTAIHAIDTVRFISASDYQDLRFQYTELAHL